MTRWICCWEEGCKHLRSADGVDRTRKWCAVCLCDGVCVCVRVMFECYAVRVCVCV